MVPLKRIIGFIVVFAAITVAFLAHPPVEGLGTVKHLDKVVHFGLFFILALSVDWAFRWKVWVSLSLLLLYGFAVEVAQSHIPGLVPDLYDWFADLAGAASYFLLKPLVIKRR